MFSALVCFGARVKHNKSLRVSDDEKYSTEIMFIFFAIIHVLCVYSIQFNLFYKLANYVADVEWIIIEIVLFTIWKIIKQ